MTAIDKRDHYRGTTKYSIQVGMEHVRYVLSEAKKSILLLIISLLLRGTIVNRANIVSKNRETCRF